MTTVLHLAERAAWEAARRSGAYRPASLDVEGFVHCSTPAQATGVANAFYRGRTDLVLLVVDADRLGPSLRWEAPAHPSAPAGEVPAGDRFPHVYGPIPVAAVLRTVDLVPAADGRFAIPPIAE